MHLTRKAFDRLVEDAIAGLPDEFAQWLQRPDPSRVLPL